VVSYDTAAEPVIAIDPGMSAIEAQEWVRRERTPVVILQYQGGCAVQSVLVFEGPEGKPALQGFWRVTDLDVAVQAARKYLGQR
jgi:hypothetical protein